VINPPRRVDPRPRVLVVASQPAEVGSIVHALGQAEIEVATAYRVEAGLVRVIEEPPDAVVVGSRLEGTDPVTFIARLRARSDVPLLALGHWGDEAAIVAVLEAGADDALPATFRPLELVARVRVLLRRRSAPPTPTSAPLPDGLRIDLGRRRATVHGRSVGVTPIEFELLAVIAARRGDVVDHRSLLRAAWADRVDVDPDLLRTHLAHLNAKLIAAGHPGLRNVRSSGYGLRIEAMPPPG